jgi:hypothetical protein
MGNRTVPELKDIGGIVIHMQAGDPRIAPLPQCQRQCRPIPPLGTTREDHRWLDAPSSNALHRVDNHTLFGRKLRFVVDVLQLTSTASFRGVVTTPRSDPHWRRLYECS